jgi:hypothetical protein
MADNIAAMISASNWMMRAWETGNEEEYRSLTTPDFRMVNTANSAIVILNHDDTSLYHI